MKRFLRGTAEVKLTGAALELCLNRWAKSRIVFWDLHKEDDLTARCCFYEAQTAMAEKEAEKAQMRLQVLSCRGLPYLLRCLTHRPALLVGTLLAVALAMFLQNFVWFIQIPETENVARHLIAEALAEEGLRFGAWGPSLNSEDMKNRVLNRIPELRWLAVNREGGVVTILAAERSPEGPKEDTAGITNVVAVRPGFVRELSVIDGVAAVTPGDWVEAGDILISGVAEWTNHTQWMHAAGVVYAETLREYEVVSPANTGQKVYTGREARSVFVIFQRNRRKISGNSSNLGAMCDRIIKTSEITLPGGYSLPVSVETQTLLQYELVPVPLSQETAMEQLQGETDRLLEAEMVAGRRLAARTQVTKEQERYQYRGSINCLEVISKTVPAELYREDAENGEIDQRGEN